MPVVEHSAVNRGVVGSSPTRGVKKPVNINVCGFFLFQECSSGNASGVYMTEEQFVGENRGLFQNTHTVDKEIAGLNMFESENEDILQDAGKNKR